MKYINLTPVKGTMTAEEMAHQLLRKIITNHKMSEKNNFRLRQVIHIKVLDNAYETHGY